MTYSEAVKFVNGWLWDSEQFGSKRSTTGVAWQKEAYSDKHCSTK